MDCFGESMRGQETVPVFSEPRSSFHGEASAFASCEVLKLSPLRRRTLSRGTACAVVDA